MPLHKQSEQFESLYKELQKPAAIVDVMCIYSYDDNILLTEVELANTHLCFPVEFSVCLIC